MMMFRSQGSIRLFSSTVLPNRIRVPNRSCLAIQGQEAKKFLQGLCTNDLNQLKKTGDCLATAFLTSKGRIFANSFIYMGKSVENNDLIVETDSSLVSELKRYLTLYKLRAKATIKSTDYAVYHDHQLTGTDAVETLNTNDDKTVVASLDPRIANYGARIVQNKAEDAGNDNDKVKEWYLTRNILHGLAEGPEILNKIPLECNLDLLHYISFNKGCYVGQELTARTRYKGLVRKRLVPFLISNSLQATATKNTNAFDQLSKDIEGSILKDTLEGKVFGAHLSDMQRVKKGYKIFKALDTSSNNSNAYEKEGAIGEILHVNSIGSIGLAMINLETIFNYQGNFAVLNIPKPAAAAEGGDESGNTITTPALGDSEIRYISTFKPSWFEGLDVKTNIKI